jgi:hypothetical protein
MQMTSPKSPNASPKIPAITHGRPDGEDEAAVEGRARGGAVKMAVEEVEVVEVIEVVRVGAEEGNEEVDEVRLVVKVLVLVVWLIRLAVEIVDFVG